MATPWTVPRMWPGRTVAILASGPSMSQDIADAVRASGVPALVTNETFRLAPWADLLFAADSAWWSSRAQDALKFPGLKVTTNESTPFRQVLHLRAGERLGFDPDPSRLATGGNGGYQALHIAVHAGAARVLLFGFDMRGGHWHGQHATPLSNPSPGTFARWVAAFETLAPHLRARGVEVLNCAPGSALRCFPAASMAEALEMTTC